MTNRIEDSLTLMKIFGGANVTVQIVMDKLGWEWQRAFDVMCYLQKSGIALESNDLLHVWRIESLSVDRSPRHLLSSVLFSAYYEKDLLVDQMLAMADAAIAAGWKSPEEIKVSTDQAWVDGYNAGYDHGKTDNE